MNTVGLKIFKTLTKLETNFVRGVEHPSIPDLPHLGQVEVLYGAAASFNWQRLQHVKTQFQQNCNS